MHARNAGSKLGIAILSMIAAQQAWSSGPVTVDIQTHYSIAPDQVLTRYQGSRKPTLKPILRPHDPAQQPADTQLTDAQLSQLSNALASQLPKPVVAAPTALAARASAITRLSAVYPDAQLKVNYTRSDGSSGFVTGLEKLQPAAFSMMGSTPPDIKTRAGAVINEVAELFGIANPDQELKIAGLEQDKMGFTHVRVQQTHNGYPVFGRSLMLHADRDESFYGVNGHVQKSVASNKPDIAISEDQAIRIALKAMQAKPNADYEVTQAPELFYFAKDDQLTLSYRVAILVGVDRHRLFLIDAKNGVVVHQYNQVHTNVSPTSAANLSGQRINFNSWEQNGQLYMVDPTIPNPDLPHDPITQMKQADPNGGDLFILDAKNAVDKDNEPTYDGLGFVTSPIASQSWNSLAVSAMGNTLQVYSYFKSTFGRDSYDGNKGDLVAIINIGDHFNNAFWNGKFMHYGNGDGNRFSEMVNCLDVAAHEMSHGVVGTTAGLLYENQSGALNESFADVFAAMVDREDWIMGEDCTVQNNGVMRDLKHPRNGLNAQPEHMNDYQNLPNTEKGDNGGVHVNSGIPNRAAYLIAEGLTDEGLGTSIGRDKTEQIYYRALTSYLVANSQFADARLALEQSARDIYGEGSELAAVSKAFDSVGVFAESNGNPSPTTPSPTTPPAPADPVAGVDYMAYLAPVDDQLFPYVYQFDGAFSGYNENDDFRISTQYPASNTRPAMATSGGETFIFYIDTEHQIRASKLSTLAQEPDLIDAGNMARSLALTPDGHYFAFTTTANDNAIYLADLTVENSLQRIVIPGQSYSQDSVSNTVLYADGLDFNYKQSQLIFDMANCISLPDSDCESGGGYVYWTIGIYNMESQKFSYPFGNQDPKIDIGYPSFSRTGDNIAAFDLVDSRNDRLSSMTVIANFNQNELTPVLDYGNVAHFGIPSFWGDDNYLAFAGTSNPVSTYRLPLADWKPSGAPIEALNSYAAQMPIMHRAGNYSVANGQELTLNTSGVTLGDNNSATIILQNTQPYDVELISIETSSGNFSHNGVNGTIGRDGSYSFDVSLVNPVQAAETGKLTIRTETGQTLEVILSAVPGNQQPDPQNPNNGGEDTPDRGNQGDGAPAGGGGGGGGGGGAVTPLELITVALAIMALGLRRRRANI